MRSTSFSKTSPAVPDGRAATRTPSSPFVTEGVIDLAGHPKPAFGVVASIYHATLQIAICVLLARSAHATTDDAGARRRYNSWARGTCRRGSDSGQT